MMPPNYSSHAAHRLPSLVGSAVPLPSNGCEPESPQVRELLESLDDAMFAAIGGHRATLDAARELWMKAIDVLGQDLLEESREQYLRYAIEVTRRFEWCEVRDAKIAMNALEVIELLTKG